MEKIVSFEEGYEHIKVIKEALLKIFNYNYNNVDLKYLKKCVFKLVNNDYSDKLYIEVYNIIYEYIIHIKNKILKFYELNVENENFIPEINKQEFNKLNFSSSKIEKRDLELYFSYNKSDNNFAYIKNIKELNKKNYKKYSYDKFMVINNLKLFFEKNENNYFNDKVYNKNTIFFKSYLYSKNLINFKNILFSNCIKLKDTFTFNIEDNECLNNFKNIMYNKIKNLFYKYSYHIFIKEREYLFDEKCYNLNNFIHLQFLCLNNLPEINYSDEKCQKKMYLQYVEEVNEDKKMNVFYILKDDYKIIEKYKKLNYENLYSQCYNIRKKKHYCNIFSRKKNKEINEEQCSSDDSDILPQEFAKYFNKTNNIYKRINLYEIFKCGLSVENNLLFNSEINKKEKEIENYNIFSIYLKNKRSIENNNIFINKVNHDNAIIKDLIYFLINYKLTKFPNIIRIAIVSICILIGKYISNYSITFRKQNKFEYRTFNNFLLLYYMVKKKMHTFCNDMNKIINKFLDLLSKNEYMYLFLNKKIITLKKKIKHYSKVFNENVLEKQNYNTSNKKYDYEKSKNYNDSNDNIVKNILNKNELHEKNDSMKNFYNYTKENKKFRNSFSIYKLPLEEVNKLFYSILMLLKNSDVFRLPFLKNATIWNYFSITHALLNSNKYNENIYNIIKKKCLKTKENAINYYTCNEKKMCIIITNKLLMNIYRTIKCKLNYNYKYEYNALLNYKKLFNTVICFWEKWIGNLKNINEIFTYMYDNFINNRMYKRKYFLKKNYTYRVKILNYNLMKKNSKKQKQKEQVSWKKNQKKVLLPFDSLGIFLFNELILNNVFIKKVIKKCLLYYYTSFSSHKKEICNFFQIIFYLDKILCINYYYNYFEIELSIFYFIYVINIMHKIIEYKNLSYFLNFITTIMLEKIYINKELHIFDNFHIFKKYIISNSFTKKHSIMFLNKYKKEIYEYFKMVKCDELKKLYSIINSVLKNCKKYILSLFEDTIINEFYEKLKNYYVFFPKNVWNNFIDLIDGNFSDKLIIQNKLHNIFSIFLSNQDIYLSKNKNHMMNNNLNDNIKYEKENISIISSKNNLENNDKFDIKKNYQNICTEEKPMYIINKRINKNFINKINEKTSDFQKNEKKNGNEVSNNKTLDETCKNFNSKAECKKYYESCFFKYRNYNKKKKNSEDSCINIAYGDTLFELVDYYLLFILLNNQENYYFLHYIFNLIYIYYKYEFIINKCFNKDEHFFSSYKKAIFKIVNSDNNITFYFSRFLDLLLKEIDFLTCYDYNVDNKKIFLKFYKQNIQKKYYNLTKITNNIKENKEEDKNPDNLIKREQNSRFISKSKQSEKINSLFVKENNEKYFNIYKDIYENNSMNEIKIDKEKIHDNKNINNNLKKKKNFDEFYYYEIFENKNYSITFLKCSLILCTLKLLQNNNKKILSHYNDINCFVNFYLTLKRKNKFKNEKCSFYDFFTPIYQCKNKIEKDFCKSFLKDIFKIFHFIEDKNEVEYYCRKFLTKRLFNGMKNKRTEKYIIKIFNNIEGDNYVYRMKNMMHDFTKYNNYFNKIKSNNDRKNINILFLRNINWLFDDYGDILLNEDIKNYINLATEELLNTHRNIKIEWIFHLSYGNLIFEISEKKYIINCNMCILIILLLFNEEVKSENFNHLNNHETNSISEKKKINNQTVMCNKLDINYIHYCTNIKRENVKQILNVLVTKYKILLNEVSTKNNNTIDLYYVNFNFFSKNEIIFIDDGYIDSAKIEIEKKRSKYIHNLEQHPTYEQYLIEAFIVKYVKKNGNINIDFLINETKKYFNHSTIDSSKINNCITHLINMDYLKKTESGTLEYI
ncbi:cullin, putative [Plasmodium gallinaceum]|uniref:Cullin, putative n=1 Tax=Plasmodium gallinaceum TaxID=5849 RepID=A0A1J1H040_PLAGA|nr:cullin, putative [Plasmodium gallinaceum]CRG97810.1 cullin, putative [Plasmodium gallinaceum]